MRGRREVRINGRLEAVVDAPDEAGGWAAVISHPHPKLGGDLDNNVVVAVAQCLNRLGVTTVRFNTRGVGGSDGFSSWFGVDERQDALAAIAYAWTLPGVTKVLMAAYSFGAAVGASIVADCPKPPSAIVLIAYPRGFWSWFLFRQHYNLFDRIGLPSGTPKLLILGEHDNFTSVSTIETMFKALSEPKTLRIIDGTDHFFFGEEHRVSKVLEEWLRPML